MENNSKNQDQAPLVFFCSYLHLLLEKLTRFDRIKLGFKKMLAKKLKAIIDKDQRLILRVPDIPPGEVEVIILKDQSKPLPVNEVLSRIPKHKMGKILSTLRREDIYTNAR